MQLAFPGAYGPLTVEGNIVVDGVLASCYAGYDQSLAHFAMKPLGWFPEIVDWFFGDDIANPAFVNIIGDLGSWLLSYGLTYSY